MANLNDILHDSAQRMAQADNRRLQVPRNPMEQRRTYWGWVATPAAAVVGVVLGMSLQFLNNTVEDNLAEVITPRDTVYLTRVEKEQVVLRDTVYQTRTRYIDRPSATPSASPVTSASSTLPQCTSIACDGIDYSMLVSR